MKLRIVSPRAVAWCNRSRTGMLALAAAGALALTAATALAPGGPVVGVQAAVLSAAPTPAPAQVRTLPLPGLLRSAPAAAAAPAAGVPATASPSVGLLSFLDGVFCTSRTRCWAVGGQAGAGGVSIANQVLRWNGMTWRKASVPNPGGTGADSVSELFAVRCVATANCWAVGEHSSGGAQLNEALHWNGKKWTAVRTPNPGGKGNGSISELEDSTCVTSADCWAVGDFGSGTGGPTEKRINQVLHWNGKKWSRLAVVNPGGTRIGHVNTLFSVRCSSANDCIAVGDYGTTSASGVLRNQALRWNGKKWSLVNTPNPGGTKPGGLNEVFALGCGATDNCWGAGSYGSTNPPGKNLNEMLHWNGSKWTKTATPNPDGTKTGKGNELDAATCVSSANCWAVGNFGSTTVGTGVGRNEALHWNGRKWAKVKTPNPGGTAAGDINELLAVRCVSSGNCWAVGILESLTNGIRDQILHWNGKKWSDVQLFSQA
jgi:hypothetical protein